MKKLFGKKTVVNTEMSLQITSMADVFTILLVFLLKSYATSAINITPSQGLALPEAHAAESSVEALKLEISRRGLQIEGKPVYELAPGIADFQFNQPEGITALSAALERERQRQNLIAQSNPSVVADGKILIIADQHVPYGMLKAVLAASASKGYTDFKLVAVRNE